MERTNRALAVVRQAADTNREGRQWLRGEPAAGRPRSGGDQSRFGGRRERGDIDLAVQTSFGLRFMVSGPLEQRDLGGLDLHVALARGLWPHLSTSDGPFPNVVEMVERGELGLKSGRGFFDWGDRDPEDVRRERTTQMIEVMSRLDMWPESSEAGRTKLA